MAAYASAHRQWTPEELAALTTEKGFRLRGAETSRLDTFVDAAFAFVLTLLVISFDEIPSDYEEMVTAIKRIPAFAVSFALLMLFWIEHRQWSRRYGFENGTTVGLSLALIFVVLVYVYPLRSIAESMFSAFTGGYLAASFSIETVDQLRGLFVFYSAGFCAMSLILRQLLRAALQAQAALRLDAYEVVWTTVNMRIWTLCTLAGAASILLALTMPPGLAALAGYVYWLLGPSIGWLVWRANRTPT